MKTANVHIKMDIASVKVRRTSFPHLRAGVHLLQLKPDLFTDAPALRAVLHKQYVKMIMPGAFVDNYNSTIYHFTIDNGFIRGRAFFIQRPVNISFWQNRRICFSENILKSFLKSCLYCF